jgi:hypothetical protein
MCANRVKGWRASARRGDDPKSEGYESADRVWMSGGGSDLASTNRCLPSSLTTALVTSDHATQAV